MDIGLGSALKLSAAETTRRLEATTKQWPIMHALFHGVSRDQMMAKHQSNHIQVVYADSPAKSLTAMQTKAALAAALGIRVSVCGDVPA